MINKKLKAFDVGMAIQIPISCVVSATSKEEALKKVKEKYCLDNPHKNYYWGDFKQMFIDSYFYDENDIESICEDACCVVEPKVCGEHVDDEDIIFATKHIREVFEEVGIDYRESTQWEFGT